MVILSRCDFDEYEKSGRLSEVVLHGASGQVMRSKYGYNNDSYIFDVPCGRCINCRLNYARKWSQRCLLEAKSWSENWFLTLTYDDEALTPVYVEDTGELVGATLVPTDVRDFLKRLRAFYKDKYNHDGIRFYMAGEYGDTTFRPHYHMIAFNVPLFDLKVYSRSPLGDIYYNSDVLSRLWGKGHVVVGEVTAQSAAYTARYCQKKANKDFDYEGSGFHKEYVNMSRRPGIALPYFEKHFEKIYENDLIYLPDGKTCHPMRYFDDKAAQYGIDIDEVKKRRLEVSTVISNEKVDEVSREYYTYLDDLENEFLKRSKMLKRNL